MFKMSFGEHQPRPPIEQKYIPLAPSVEEQRETLQLIQAKHGEQMEISGLLERVYDRIYANEWRRAAGTQDVEDAAFVRHMVRVAPVISEEGVKSERYSVVVEVITPKSDGEYGAELFPVNIAESLEGMLRPFPSYSDTDARQMASMINDLRVARDNNVLPQLDSSCMRISNTTTALLRRRNRPPLQS